MSFQSSSHFDSTTLLIVKTEIDNTIKNVEAGVTSLIEDGALPFGIDDALVNLEQCSHVLNLIDQRYIARLTELVAKVMQKVIQDSQKSQIKQTDVEAMSEATNIIKRYLDFLCIRETRAPQFLIPVMNKLEIALNLPLTREGIFLNTFLETLQPSVKFDAPENFPASQYVLRLYKLSLLHILQDKASELDFRAMALCGHYFATQAVGTPSAQYWQFVYLALKHLDHTILTEPRLRVLIAIERQSTTFAQSPRFFSATQHDFADILALCLSQDSEVSQEIRAQLGVYDDVLSDSQLEVLSHQLYGPDFDTIQTVVDLLSQKITDVSSKIEMGLHVESAEVRENIYDNLSEVAKILDVINLNDAARQLQQQADHIRDNAGLTDPQNADRLMNTLLFATNSLQILERNYTPVRLKLKFNNTQITLAKVEEAQDALCHESRLTLAKVCNQVTQYAQDQDNHGLQTLAEQLREVSGALLFLESKQGHTILQKAANLIEQNILPNNKILTLDQLRLLANTIISADFFFEQMQNKQPLIEKSLQVGEQSIMTLEQAVA